MANFVLVDDSLVARGFLKNVLEENGHNVVAEASNGQEGYEYYIKHNPDIIMIDMTMPVMSGMDCLKKIKAEVPGVKSIIVSSVGKTSKKAEALLSGAFDYVEKPFDPDNLMNIVERCLNA